MKQVLPSDGFQWCTNTLEEILATPDNIGFLVEVDLDYPADLRDAHGDYPLAPEALNVPKTWLDMEDEDGYIRVLVNELGSKYTYCTRCP